MANYLPLYRPGDTVTFSVTSDVAGGQAVEVGVADMSVAPASAASTKYVGVAGHDAKVGDNLTVEVGKPIHELTAVGAVTRGAKLELAANGDVQTATTGDAVFLALASAAAGEPVAAIQL